MTKNNLSSHLKWLVKQGPSLYPSLSPSAHESQRDADAWNSAREQPALELGRLDVDPAPTRDSDSERIPGTFVEDTGDNDAEVKDDNDTDTNMARLLFAPQSASKPRLLSSSKKSPSGTPKASKDRAFEKSPTEQPKTRNLNVVKDPQRDPPPSIRSNKPITTPNRPKRTFDLESPTLDIDAIDLTGDSELPTAPSSSILEEFGEPHRLWTEEAAFRKDPLEKRGKKRKSEEYKSDILSRNHAPTVRSPLAPSKSAVSKEPSLMQIPQASPTPRATSSHFSPPSTKQRERLSPLHHSNHPEDHVIPDSDDDGGDDLFDGWMQDEDPILENDEELYPVLPTEGSVEEYEDMPRKRPAKAHAPSFDTEDLTRKPRSPTKRSSPKKQASPRKSQPIDISPIETKIPSSQPKQDEDIVKFLAVSNDSLGRIIMDLKNTLTKNSEIVYQQAMEGVPALELITVNKSLKDRIGAVEQLKQEKMAYQACESKKDHLKKVLIRVISQGDDPSSLPELAESRAVSAELGQIEEDIRRLLSQADILHMVPDCSRMTTPMCATEQPSSSPHARRDNSSRDMRNDAYTSNGVGSSLFVSPARPKSNSNMSRVGILAPAPEPVSKTSMNKDMFDYDDPMSDGDDYFSRNMGSPKSPVFDADEFDLDSDDEDMLEVAGHFEGRHPLPTDGYESRSRKVFGETSGNALPAPPAEKSPARTTALWNQHSWSVDVKNVLKDHFHLRGFRLNQLEAIDATLSGKDTFVLMPTGGGKSLCYQLPSIVYSGSTRGVTIVISPLLSLMQDQVEHLQRLKIKALLLNGDTTKEERQWIMSTLSSFGVEDHIQLLYITPEMISKNQTLIRILEKLHRMQRLARIVIDEAHCVSQWGHDFRPDYKELGEIRAQLPGVPMMALTATATENVKVDVIHNLKMDGCEVFTQSFNRPNLTYEVLPKSKGAGLLASVADVIKTSYRNQSGIVYCLSRKTCEKVAESLQKQHGIKAAFYHAGMETPKKIEVQQRWQSGRYHVIVATIAFGMGIDKPDVRFVIHHSIPKSLEGYYQETGRAGRDGKRSGCYLYYNYGDTTTISRMIDDGEGSWEQKERQRQMLRNVVQYCENKSDCRRVQILAYFNEYFRREHCNKFCDNCKSDSVFETHDFTEYAALAIKLVRHFQEALDEKVTMSYCVKIFRDSVKSFKTPQHRKIPWRGAGSALELGEAERLFQRLLSEGALYELNVVNAKKFATQYIRLGRRAVEFESGRRELKLQVRLSPKGKSNTARPTNKNRARNGNNDYPQSTNVSSPVQSADQRRLARFRHRTAKDEESHGEDSDDFDDFEKIRIAGKPRQESKRALGPPITDDGDFSRLDHIHQAIAEDFMCHAKQHCQNIMVTKGLRDQPFTDGVLRQMAIRFPRDLSELSVIPGIDANKVARYGTQILKLVRDTERRLAEFKQDAEASGIVADPNHRNVIEISDGENNKHNDGSDEDYGGDDLFMDQASSLLNVDDGDVISSRFFPNQPTATQYSSDEFHDAVSEQGGPKSRKRQASKRPRRKTPSGSGFKGKGSKAKTKSGEGTGSRASSARKVSKAKPSAPRIPAMPT